MANTRPSSGSSGGGSSPVGSTATIIVSVESDGSDASSANRPAVLSGGDYSAFPFATLDAALRSLTHGLFHQAFVRVGAGSFVGATASGFFGGGIQSGRKVGLNINGTTALANFDVGPNYSTAGTGTNSTTLVLDSGDDPWEADTLTEFCLKITDGGGSGDDPVNFPVIRPIVANTETTIAVEPIPGMDETSDWEIVTRETKFSEIDPSTNLVCIQPCFNSCPIRISAVDFQSNNPIDSLVSSANNAYLELNACKFAQATDAPSVLSDCDSVFAMKFCDISNAADTLVRNCSTKVTLEGLWCHGASIVDLLDCRGGNVSLRSEGAVSHALRMVNAGAIYAEVLANNGGATAVYSESTDLVAVGTNLLTGSGNDGYGIQIEGGGLVDIAGADITGNTGDILFNSVPSTWVLAGSLPYGVLASQQGSAVLRTVHETAILTGNYEYLGGANFGGRAYFRGYINPSFGEAVVNLANATPFDMANTNRGGGVFNCTHASGTAILPDGAALGGVPLTIINIGDTTMTLQAPGPGVITGAATVPAGGVAMFVSLFGNSGKDFIRVAL